MGILRNLSNKSFIRTLLYSTGLGTTMLVGESLFTINGMHILENEKLTNDPQQQPDPQLKHYHTIAQQAFRDSGFTGRVYGFQWSNNKTRCILSYLSIGLLFSFSSACFSENCASSMDGYDFFSATINENGQAGCGYRYCYYNCDYKHYRLKGKYIPEHGTWIPEGEGLNCYDSSRACTFIKKPKLPYQFSQ